MLAYQEHCDCQSISNLRKSNIIVFDTDYNNKIINPRYCDNIGECFKNSCELINSIAARALFTG